MIIDKINLDNFSRIVFFTGAGMSAESGIPTFRGKGGIWHDYNWEEYACEIAFKKNPKKKTGLLGQDILVRIMS